MSVSLKSISWADVKEIKHLSGCRIIVNGVRYRADNYGSDGCGTRWKFFGKDFIVKVDSRYKFATVCGYITPNAIYQSKGEYDTYNKIHKRDRKWFTTPLYFDGRSLIVHALHDLRGTFTIKPKHKSIIERLKDKYNIGDIDVDYGHNCALIMENGKLRPIIFDYGWVNET